MRVKNRGQVPETGPHLFHPTHGNAVRALLVKKGHNLLFQDVVEVAAFNIVLGFMVLVDFPVTQGPSEVPMITLIPPAVKHTEV